MSQYKAIVEASPDLIVCLDREGQVGLVNAALERATRLPRALMIGRPFEALLVPDARGAEAWSSAAPFERSLHVAQGRPRRVEWRATHYDEHCTFLFGQDVTETRAAERRLRVVEQLAVVRELTSGLAHEIRNPLNSALLALKVAARRLGATPPTGAREGVSSALAELERIERLLTDFLWFARPASVTALPGRLAAPAEAVARLVSAEVAERGIQLTTSFDPAASPVVFDENCIRQATFHLVRNAIEALSAGGHIALRVRAGAVTTELEVEDDGPGIEGDLGRLFVPFHTTRRLGTGLGLTIVQRIAADHAGEVRVESAPGRTVFTLVLPALRRASPGGDRHP